MNLVGITPSQFNEMQQRLSGRRAAAPVLQATPLSRPAHSVILGIDPSLRGTGFGVIRTGKPLSALAHGTISCPARYERSRCLALIYETLEKVMAEHKPDCCVVEGLFFAQNLQTAIIMGEARGAALAAVAKNGLEVYELATRKVKQAIVGYGAAQKSAVAKMVQRMLQMPKEPASDEADALALALAFAQETGRYALNSHKRV